MKKSILFLMAITAILASCHTNEPPTPKEEMVLNVNGVGRITADTTIVITEAAPALSGAIRMSIDGSIKGVSAFQVQLSRPLENIEDEFCAAGACVSGNQQLKQDFSYENLDPLKENTWFAHFSPFIGAADYSFVYKFISAQQTIALTVVYSYDGF